jgi:hypothetical protein
MNSPDSETDPSSRNGHGEPIEEGDRIKASASQSNGHGEGTDDAPMEDLNGHGEPDHPAPQKPPASPKRSD